ncbi:MAG: YhgE/Pip domain-containing protein [Candidatus Pristimantibacillus sp.]
MNLLQTLKDLMKLTQTKIGLVFAIFVPLLFIIVWMTGYQGATDRIDQLNVVIVNEDGSQGEQVQQQLINNVPFHSEVSADVEEAQSQMDKGDYSMVIVIPPHFTEEMNNGQSELVFYINQAASDVAKSMLEQSALQISAEIGQHVQSNAVQANIIKSHNVGDFSTSMLPMILGFVTYIAMMTMNIQFNITSQILKRNHSKWSIFWSRQILLLCIAIIVPLIITGVAMIFSGEIASSFVAMWGFQVLVFLSCICLTQMSFTLFGNAGPLFNVALVPIQLMTAGSIIPAMMLTPFYRHLDNFFPVPNAIHGYLKLIYNGEPVTQYVIHLLLISIVTWGITILRLSFVKQQNPLLQQPAHA